MYQFHALLARNPQEHSTALQPYKSTGPTHPVLTPQVAITALSHSISRCFKTPASGVSKRVLMPSLLDSSLKTKYRCPITTPHPTPLMLEVTDHSPVSSIKAGCFRHPVSTPEHYQTTQIWVPGANKHTYTYGF